MQNTYYDSTHQVGSPPQQFANQTWWQYLNFYRDVNTGVGGQITYATAYNNAHGTPNGVDQHGNPDDRYDPLYCTTHSDCTGNYAHPDDNAWAEQVVTQITAWSQDSSSSSLQRATTSYAYRLAKTGTWDGKTTWCYPAGSDQDCVGDNWLPLGDSDWADYSHDEYQGFNQVYITSPANDLTVDSYYSTEGWNTPGSDYQNFEGATLYEQDVYSGNSPTTTALLSTTTSTYANNSNACRSTSQTYPACEWHDPFAGGQLRCCQQRDQPFNDAGHCSWI